MGISIIGGSSIYWLRKLATRSAPCPLTAAKAATGCRRMHNTLLGEKNIIGTYLPASDVEAYNAKDEFYGGQEVNKLLADWMAQIPAVNTGAFSAEAQAALTAVMPQYLAGGDMAECLEEAAAQFEQSIQ